jgi:hypothetical protein
LNGYEQHSGELDDFAELVKPRQRLEIARSRCASIVLVPRQSAKVDETSRDRRLILLVSKHLERLLVEIACAGDVALLVRDVGLVVDRPRDPCRIACLSKDRQTVGLDGTCSGKITLRTSHVRVSKQTAEDVWEPKFLGEIIAGRDPRVGLKKPALESVVTVAEFLDRYYTNYVEAEGLKSARTISGHIKALKASLGDLPVSVLEKPTEIMRFKAAFRHGHQVATVNRILGVLRAAINWGTISGSAVAFNNALPPFRRQHQGQRRNETGSAHSSRGGASAAGGMYDDEVSRAQVCRIGDARPDHRRIGDVLSSGHSVPALFRIAAIACAGVRGGSGGETAARSVLISSSRNDEKNHARLRRIAPPTLPFAS